MSIACITPFAACTFVTITWLVLPFGSVIIAVVASISTASPSVTTVPVTKSSARTFAPATTWVLRVAVKIAPSTSSIPATPSSAYKSANAWLVGAKTVKGAGAVPLAVVKTLT